MDPQIKHVLNRYYIRPICDIMIDYVTLPYWKIKFNETIEDITNAGVYLRPVMLFMTENHKSAMYWANKRYWNMITDGDNDMCVRNRCAHDLTRFNVKCRLKAEKKYDQVRLTYLALERCRSMYRFWYEVKNRYKAYPYYDFNKNKIN
jgi:hypothetical protein